MDPGCCEHRCCNSQYHGDQPWFVISTTINIAALLRMSVQVDALTTLPPSMTRRDAGGLAEVALGILILLSAPRLWIGD